VALAPRRPRRARSRVDGGVPRAPPSVVVHVGEAALALVRARLGTPLELTWKGEISDAEWAIATHNPARTHDVTLFILDPSRRVALIRKPHFEADVWRPPGGGVRPGEDFAAGAAREALEETGLHVELRRYLVASRARFRSDGRELAWQTHVLLAETADEELAPDDPGEIAAARWGTLDELAGPVRERLLAGAVDQRRPHADALGPRELVVRAVTDEQRLRGLDLEALARQQVDPRIGLPQPDVAGEHLGVEETVESGLRPHRRHVVAA